MSLLHIMSLQIATSAPAGQLFVRADVGTSVLSYQAPSGNSPASTTIPGLLWEKVAAGFWPIPRLRVEVSTQIRETFGGSNVVVSSNLGANARWRFVEFGPLYADLGAVVTFHPPSPTVYDLGGVAAVGLRASFGHGFAGAVELQAPVVVVPRFTLSVVPLANVMYRF